MKTLMAILLAATALVPSAQQAAADCARAAANDFDGDGQDDVVVGDPFADTVSIVSAGKVIPVDVPAEKGDGLGWSVRLTRLNADGCADLVVGAPYADVNGTVDAGAVYLVYGGGVAPPKRLVAPEPQRDAHFGWSLAAKGDLLAVGAPYEDQAQLADAGSVYVRKGEGALRRIQEDTDGILGNAEVGDQFGWSLAFTSGNALAVGVPYENDDGPGRQVASGKIDSGSITVVKDVLAATLASVKWDSPTKTAGDRYGYAVAYSDRGGLAVSAPGAGYVQLFDANLKAGRTIRGVSGVTLAAAQDGRLAIGSPSGVRVTGQGEDRTISAPGLSSLTFSGNKVFVGLPDAGRYGTVSSAGRNDSTLKAYEPAKGADFGSSVAG
ncbi:FG-GAP repeat protein [Nonomuraea sediminis]|uniref:FG-GAP repeat protein n=1 Tax=Nonomuraea sediminis TaxID=2835864 RepID=UPI001BDD2B44|nr:FG-GAP repeat protein [Nonomuraea sediminis]